MSLFFPALFPSATAGRTGVDNAFLQAADVSDEWRSPATPRTVQQGISRRDIPYARYHLHRQYAPLINDETVLSMTREPHATDETVLPVYTRSRDALLGMRQRLHDDAQAFFARNAFPRAPVPVLPADPASAETVLTTLLKQRRGLIFGDDAGCRTGIRFLIGAMPLLRESGVKTLFINGLDSDFFQSALDRAHAVGERFLGREVIRRLAEIDAPATPTGACVSGYHALITAALRHEFRVICLNAAAARPGDPSETLDDTRWRHYGDLPGAFGKQMNMANYFACQVIHDSLHPDGDDKWVALCDVFQLNVNRAALEGSVRIAPGLADLTQATSIRMTGADQGGAFAVLTDVAVRSPARASITETSRTMLPDFTVRWPDHAAFAPRQGVVAIDDSLRTGQFHLHRSGNSGSLRFRLPSGAMSSAPVEFKPLGGLEVEGTGWPHIDRKRFATVGALEAALDRVNLRWFLSERRPLLDDAQLLAQMLSQGIPPAYAPRPAPRRINQERACLIG